MKLITILLALILSFSALSEETVDCVGHSNIILVKDGKRTSVEAMYIINLSKLRNGYISQSGQVLTGNRSYKIDRFYNIDVQPVSESGDLFEFRIRGITRHEPDSVPADLPGSFFLNQQRLYRIQRTLVTSYLISDAYSPVLVCHQRTRRR